MFTSTLNVVRSTLNRRVAAIRAFTTTRTSRNGIYVKLDESGPAASAHQYYKTHIVAPHSNPRHDPSGIPLGAYPVSVPYDAPVKPSSPSSVLNAAKT